MLELTINSRFGKFIVKYDEGDHDLISQYKWSIYRARPKFDRLYAHANGAIDGKRRAISMHRLLMGHPKDMEVDHIDHDGLNNVRSNLRVATHSQNNMNKRNQVSNTTGFKGVYKYNRKGRFKQSWTYIWVDNKRISGGYFEKIEDAAKKYNELAQKYHKEFAYLNKI